MKIETFGWEAWYNRMPGTEDERLHVAGTCRLPSSSIEVSLELGNPGVAPEPGVVVLELTAIAPDVGDDLMTEREVGWQGEVGGDAERVRIIGDSEASMEVTIAR